MKVVIIFWRGGRGGAKTIYRRENPWYPLLYVKVFPSHLVIILPRVYCMSVVYEVEGVPGAGAQ